MFSAALCFPERESELKKEWATEVFQSGRLFIGPRPSEKLIWAQDEWPDFQLIPFTSVSEGARLLKALSLRWVLFSQEHHRRASLIQSQLKSIENPALQFLEKTPVKKYGAWTLLDEKLILACLNPLAKVPLGEIQFAENKTTPPNRAYLKVWELFTLHIDPPERGSRVLDMGSSPGGWTWVLQGLGAHVTSVDKAPLDLKIQKLPRVQSVKKDAFQLLPSDVGPVDWFFSDLICTPEKLHELVCQWRDSGLVKNFVCTIKFKGLSDFQMLKKFKELEGSQLIHLVQNKNEVTWILKGSSKEKTSMG